MDQPGSLIFRPCSSRAILEHRAGPGGSGTLWCMWPGSSPVMGRDSGSVPVHWESPNSFAWGRAGKNLSVARKALLLSIVLDPSGFRETLSCCWLYLGQTFPEVGREASGQQIAPARNEGDVQARRMCFISLHPVRNACLYWDQSKHPSQPAQRSLVDLFS